MSGKKKFVGSITDVQGTVHIEWNIRNYAKLIQGKKETFYLASPTFEILAATWRLVLYPCNLCVSKDRYLQKCVSIYLEKCSSTIEKHCVSFLVEMKLREKIEHSFLLEKTFRKDERHGSKDIRVSGILGPEDSVTILLYVYPTNSTIREVSAYSSSTNVTFEGMGILSTNMENLYQKQQDCDFTIKVKARKFKVHKAILAARSPVFYSMLQHDMVEKKNGVLDVVDSEPEIFEHFLRYLYSGRVDHLNWTNVAGLYELGDKYDLQFLKKECHKYMLNKICVERSFDFLVFATKHEQAFLKCVKEFFVENVKTILPSDEWQEFIKENPTLCSDLFISYVSEFPSERGVTEQPVKEEEIQELTPRSISPFFNEDFPEISD